MNTHLTQEELILRYYSDPALGERGAHFDTCEECQTELARLAAILDRVTPQAVPEPDEDYESRVWNRLEWRLRTEKKRAAIPWVRWATLAAMLALAFVGGLLFNRRQATAPSQQTAANTHLPSTNAGSPKSSNQDPATSTSQTVAHTAKPAAGATATPQDRILLLVVGEHFGESERMLLELTNLTPKSGTESGDFDITTERTKAEELLASNRLYRRTAIDRGEESVATLLDELEPVLLSIAHAPDDMTADELRTMQKRVETKGLVFKLRVIRADVTKKAAPEPRTTQPTA
jgi:cytoskeletal protein RodZ